MTKERKPRPPRAKSQHRSDKIIGLLAEIRDLTRAHQAAVQESAEEHKMMMQALASLIRRSEIASLSTSVPRNPHQPERERRKEGAPTAKLMTDSAIGLSLASAPSEKDRLGA